MRASQVVLVLMSAVMLAGCPKRTTTVPDSGAGSDSGASTSGAGTSGSPSGQQMTAEELARQELQKSGMIIYFDYDRAEIKSEYVSVVAAHAKYLNANPSRRARLEGHTDERGSREYNIGLGERRAQAVRRALLLQGVSESQLATVSYGEERPAVAGNDDAAYAKNRRVEIVYGQ